jgi:hypothetical protein
VSDYYDLFLSVELQPALPDEVMHEIRWHLGLVDEPPGQFQALPDADWFIGEPVALFSGLVQSHSFDGVDVAAMLPATNRIYPDRGQRWLLTVRQCVHDDELGWVLDLAEWIASKSTTVGWIGFLRHDQAPVPDLMHYVNGRLEFGQPGMTRPFGAGLTDRRNGDTHGM